MLETGLPDAKLIVPTVRPDDRGFFCEVYRRDAFEALGISAEFVQDNHSRSARGVLRGLHFQIGAGVAKLVRCARGRILDVAVDLRRGSPTYGRWAGVELDDVKMRSLYVPVGFAHGFCTISEVADVVYSQTGYYAPQLERAIAYDDPELAIEWPQGIEFLVSERDAAAPTLREQADELQFPYPAA